MMDYDNSVMSEAIAESIHNAMHRDILRLRLIDGLTYEQIAERVNRTPRQIGRIMAKDTPRLYDWMKRRKMS